MWKFILSFLSVFFTCSLAQAQTPYGVYQIPFTPETFDPVNTVSLYDDAYSGIIDIGFPFVFFGESYESLVISSNGYVRFQLEYAGNFSDFSVNQSLPDPTAPLDAIFLSWFDLDPSSQPIISYATIGTAPERVFIVNYNNVPYFGCNQTLYNGQLKLYEGSNNIEMHITSRPFCDNSGGWVNLAIQGIQNVNATQAYHVPGRNNNAVWQASNDAWRFDPDTVNAPSSFLNGRVIADFNGNCVLDENDYAIPGQVLIRDANQAFTTTNQSGAYSFETVTGSYQVGFNGLTANLPFGTINCPVNATYNVNLTETGEVADSLDFFIYPDSSCADPQITISPMGPFRRCAGNDNHQVVFINNHGMLPIQGYSVSVTVPDSLYLYNTVPAYSSQDGNTFTWNFTDTLVYGELTTIHLYDSLSCYATDGLLKCISATVTALGDCDETNNLDDVCQIVNGSYDPNHIQLLTAPPTPQYVYTMEVEGDEQWYTYRIQFQNTGTAPAQTVVVTDILPPFFDYNSAEFLGSSHNCSMVNEGNGTFKFVHYNINLPDSSENFAASIGTIVFKVRAFQMLFPGQEILNRASIVFDVNEPVITNDAVFGVPLPEGLQDLTNGFDFYPNPADQSLIINSDLNKGTVQLTDISGRIIVSQPITSKQTSIETSQIPAGVYFIELMVENRKLSNQKLIIAH
jgi:hypothetical protein